MNRKRVWILGGVILVLISAVRYRMLNGCFGVETRFPTEVYSMGETVEFGDAMSFGKRYYAGYSISVDECKIYDIDDYLKQIKKSKDDFELLLGEKVVEVTVTLSNNNKDFEIKESDEEYTLEDAIELHSFQLWGIDWYEYINRELMAYANPVFEDDPSKSPYIVILPEESYQLKVIFNLAKKTMGEKRWEKIDKEEMMLGVTVAPVEKRIKLS